MRKLVLIAFAFSGMAALIYEVVWTRELALILGSTTYALSTMLSTFMAGLALGGILGGRVADRKLNLFAVFGFIELAIGLFGLLTIPAINSLSPLYFKMYRAFHLSPGLFFAFQFLLCSGIMLIPTTLMGATFPIVSKAVTHGMDDVGRSVGNAYSYNTLGAILGSFSAGFMLIPFFGVKASTMIAAVLNIAVGASMLVSSKTRIKTAALIAVLITYPAAFSWAWISEEDPWAVNFYKAGLYRHYQEFKYENVDSKVYIDKDFREGRVKLWRSNQGYLMIQVGGKIEGSGVRDITNTHLLAYLPIASHGGKPKTFLNIGLGAGITLGAAKQHIKDVSLVEINEGVVEGIGRFGPPGLLDGIDITINDARNYLKMTDRKFDIISSEPSYPADAPTANLFTKEFYELAESRLDKGGMFCQWLPYYLIDDYHVTMMIKTFGSVFENVYMWKSTESADLLMVGSDEPFMYSADEIQSRVKGLNINGIGLNYKLSKDPMQVADIIASAQDVPYNTDDHPLLEYHISNNFIGIPER